MTEALPLGDIVQALRHACFEGQTGRFHIVTSDNHKAMFVLEQGTIIGVSYRIRRGQRALGAILDISAGRWRFEQGGYLPDPDPDLPDTRSILQQLRAQAPPVNVPTPASQSASPVAQNSSEVASAPSTAPLAYLPERMQTDLIALLTSVIGPIASLLVPATLQSAPDAETALTLLAQEIPDVQVARQFKQEAWALLNNV